MAARMIQGCGARPFCNRHPVSIPVARAGAAWAADRWPDPVATTAITIEQKDMVGVLDKEIGRRSVPRSGDNPRDQSMPVDDLLTEAFAHQRGGRLGAAEMLYRQALVTDPKHWVARVNLVQLLMRAAMYEEAVGLLTQLLEEFPDHLLVNRQLGTAYAALNRLDLSLVHFQRILAQKPDDVGALQFVSNIQHALGRTGEASRNFRRSVQLQPLVTVAATRSPPGLRLLLLFAPGAGNTPFDYLVAQVEYETHLLNLLPDIAYDADMLRGCTDVVFNLVADVDLGGAMLAPARDLAERIGKPVVNHPRQIMRTGRASIARLLAGIADCVVPQTRGYAGAALRAADFDLAGAGFGFPLLVRLAGTHGGEDLEKVQAQAELDGFVLQRPEADYYLTEYVDYRSADGWFRKYRFIFVGGAIHPYHLAIGEQWKVHHVTTDMANQPWMQEEEKSFLDNPQGVFGPRQYAALEAIRRTVDLDYFGIDCALDRAGRVVVFEVNACMLVHGRNQQFPYKAAAVSRIKAAFCAMLEGVAATGRCAGSA
jgi:glutathione synthase/RimK-type ligase-like ATP-grasp enzyme